MRYIGSKQALLDRLSFEINLRAPKTGIFCDLFSGSAAVARHFKKRNYKIISNDIMHFSYFLQAATIDLNSKPNFSKLFLVATSTFTSLLVIKNTSMPKSDAFLRNDSTPGI